LGEAASPPDLLSALVFTRDPETGAAMDDQQVRDELMTLFIAGHETTAVLLGWVWVLLAQNPAVEAKLHAELDTALGGQPPTLADMAKLPYTLQVIKEALRLYPPAWFMFRQNFEPITLGGEDIRANSILFLFPYATQRDPRWFDEPERFKPERWADDFEKTLPKGAYFPFGMGPRVCIGNGFAMMEAQLLLATIAQRFRLELRGEARPFKGTTTLGFERSVPMAVYRRA
jgi:cytochrome P450